MILGLDVGGTHTDAVLVDETGIVASHKTVTDHNNMLNSINAALEAVVRNVDTDKITKVNLSTTLSTNAIIENRLEDVGVIVSAGPGIDPALYEVGSHFHTVEGSIDHRGSVILALNEKQLSHAVKKTKNLSVFALASKFSTRNPDHENQFGDCVKDHADYITYGHRLSGHLNFPRRIYTAYYNSAVWRLYNTFSDAVDSSLKKLKLDKNINILKADGGTMPFHLARAYPVESILSGPAASVLGIVGLCSIAEDSIILDIGGTTTDIAIFIAGHPLIEREGISMDGKPTLVRSIETRSIGIGGDSLLHIEHRKVLVGPQRKGPSMADGGPGPTLIDALNYKGIISYGDVESSRKGIEETAIKNAMRTDALADDAINYAINSIKTAVDAFLDELNSKPVYTIHEMFQGEVIKPEKIFIMGGPAEGFSSLLSDKFGLDVNVPANFEVANAIGAALAKTTFMAELFADTTKGFLVIPNLNIKKKIDSDFTLADAEKEIKSAMLDYIRDHAINAGPDDIEIIEETSFKMVTGYYSTGRDIRVKCQIKPGVVMSLCDCALSQD